MSQTDPRPESRPKRTPGAQSRPQASRTTASRSQATRPQASRPQTSRTASRPQTSRSQTSRTAGKPAAAKQSSAPVKRQNAGAAAAPKRRRSAPVRRTKTPRPTEKPKSTALSGLVKAIIYICFILVSAGFLSYFGITAGNDIFALKKSEEQFTVTVDEGTDVTALAELLHEKGIIRYPKVFELYAKLRKKTEGFIATTETVSPSMDYDALLAAFKQKRVVPEQLRITIPEGYAVDDIIDLFLEKGIGTREGFVEAVQNYEQYDYWFIDELKATTIREGRTYNLEGYLYPDTYYFYSTSDETTVVNKMLANFSVKFEQKFRDRAKELGWTIDDVVILASMIQKEGKYESDYGRISSVFHNRLATNKTQGLLQSDAVLSYILKLKTVELTAEQLAADTPYNTRLYEGLPPGPITNASLYSINYALYPTDTNYFYFVSKKDGTTLFAETYAEHLANVELVRTEEAGAVTPKTDGDDE